jgi:hypothetical protein
VAASGEKRWPPVGNFVATNGENSMAIDIRKAERARGHGCGRCFGSVPGQSALGGARESAGARDRGELDAIGRAIHEFSNVCKAPNERAYE